jgi:hypothetical protein
MWPVASTAASAPTATSRVRSEAIISRRRESRSASAQISKVVSSATDWQTRTIPSMVEPASVNVFQPSAVTKAASPISDTAWPVNRRRKSRWRSAWSARGDFQVRSIPSTPQT